MYAIQVRYYGNVVQDLQGWQSYDAARERMANLFRWDPSVRTVTLIDTTSQGARARQTFGR